MKIVQLNTICGSGSTGKICVTISEMLTEQGIENYIYYSSGNSNYYLGRRYMSSYERKLQALKTRILGNFGFNSKTATKRLIKELDKISPDIIHLHNLHGYNIHLGAFFTYLKKKKLKIIWTFHDCWSFTGYCSHYDMIGCDKWKNGGCHNCPLKSKTSWFFDRSRYLYNKKKSLFTNLDMQIITPSQWLADQVKQSFLSEYNVKVINNGIDLSIFCPKESDFRQKHGIEDKFILIGVAHIWCKQKGLDVFIELSKRLDERFAIVLVGTDDKIDKQLPNNIISIHRTNNQEELAEIYTAADVFVNPTREENFPTVNMEAIACGTPVLTFRTGGSPEIIDEHTGFVVERDDEEALYKAIIEIEQNRPFSKDNCVEHAKKFNQQNKYSEYIDLLCRLGVI